MKRKAELLAEGMRDQGYDVITPGDTDFVYGWDEYENLIKTANVPVVCSNLKVGDSYPFKRFLIKDVDGVKFGFIGLIHPTFKIPPRGGQEVTIEDPAIVAQELVTELRPRVDALIALTHIGLRDDESLATKVSGIDFIFGGHSREILGYPNHYGRTQVYQGGKQGKYVGWVKLKATPHDDSTAPADSQQKFDLAALTSELRPVKQEDWQEPKYKAKIEEYHAWAKDVGKDLKPGDQVPLSPRNNDVYWGETLCGQCHAKQHEFWKKTSHAHAYQTLVNANKQFDMECLACHTTGFDALKSRMKHGAKTMVDVKGMENVQCESCHAPGSRHSLPEIKGRALEVQTCVKCHNTTMDPTFDHVNKLKLMSCPPSNPG